MTDAPGAIRALPELVRGRSLEARRTFLSALVVTLAAIVVDQFAAPILQTTSPLWAVTTCLLLVWQRGRLPVLSGITSGRLPFPMGRLAAFLVAHLELILVARLMTSAIQPVVGTGNIGGTLVAAWKLSVLIPAIVLLPLSVWKELLNVYACECKAAVVVLFTFSPWRALGALWPWYGQLLGRFVHGLSALFVSSLGYVHQLNPTLTGPDLDITIILACSGINGLELFGYLFGLMVLLDWNHLRKGRALLAYFAGLVVVLLTNALRITSFVVFGNHGFADSVLRFHVSAGWMFFSAVFLIYLSLTYSWMIDEETGARPSCQPT